MQLCRFHLPGAGVRLGYVHAGNLYDITDRWASMADWLRWSVGRADMAGDLAATIDGHMPVGSLAAADRPPAEDALYLLKPTDTQEIWAAGVTYERSRVAREEESAGSGIYDRVYLAERPEIFFKATPSRTVGPYQDVVIRNDSRWNVPEPELALVINPALELVGFTVGNDMSSRDIEGENPLYLPQAKVYAACCALGPAITLSSTVADPKNLDVHITIRRDGADLFSGNVSTGKIVRAYRDLIGYLGRDNLFPDGVLLLTGTGIVPPDHVSLEGGDEVEITITSLGTLRNRVRRGAS